MLFVPHASLENIKMKGIELNINKRSNFYNFETLFIHLFWWEVLEIYVSMKGMSLVYRTESYVKLIVSQIVKWLPVLYHLHNTLLTPILNQMYLELQAHETTSPFIVKPLKVKLIRAFL